MTGEAGITRRAVAAMGLAAAASPMTACAPPNVKTSGPPPPPGRFAQLRGWVEADHEAALSTFHDSLSRARPGGGVTAEDWAHVRNELARSRFASARGTFEGLFEPVFAHPGRRALFTAYFEPELAGAPAPDDVHRFPIYVKPPDLGRRRYHSREKIEAGVLSGRGLELAWLADPVEAFFLHIQGSGRIRFPDGQIMRVGYAAQNRHPYVAIGRLLVDREIMPLEDVTADSLKAWLRADEERGIALMNENPSYVFFEPRHELAAHQGPLGAMEVPLTAGYSVAVDPNFHPLGGPIWVEAEGVPGFEGRLMIAQDIGGAIKGAHRADLYIGSGAEAGVFAGNVRAEGRIATLIPRAAAERIGVRA